MCWLREKGSSFADWGLIIESNTSQDTTHSVSKAWDTVLLLPNVCVDGTVCTDLCFVSGQTRMDQVGPSQPTYS